MKPLDTLKLSTAQLALLATILKAVDDKMPEEWFGKRMRIANLCWKERQYANGLRP